MTIDFGMMAVGETNVKEFTITNTGDHQVTVTISANTEDKISDVASIVTTSKKGLIMQKLNIVLIQGFSDTYFLLSKKATSEGVLQNIPAVVVPGSKLHMDLH